MSDLLLVIGNWNYSSWSLRPWLALRMSGLPFRTERIPLYQPHSKARLLAHSALGLAPVLKRARAGHGSPARRQVLSDPSLG